MDHERRDGVREAAFRRWFGQATIPQLLLTLATCAFLVAPVIMSILAGVTHNYFVGIRGDVALQWLTQVWELYSRTIFLSLQVALACLGVTLVIGVPAAYVLARSRSRLTRLVEELLVLPVAVPGLATGLALILTYGDFRAFRASWVFILVGHVLFTLPFMTRSVLAVMMSIDLRTLEEGAASLGASFRQRFFGIIGPRELRRPAMAIKLRDSAVSIRLEGCGKTFADGTRALEPLTLDIGAGETVVFLGPSGCGKTTTLRLIAGLEAPDAGGCVRFGADDVTRLPIEKRNVGMVFQSYALFPNMNVAENVAYGLKVRRIAATVRATHVSEMLSLMHLDELADRGIDQLSGGQRQRVALARALIVKPRVLLLDEPLTALDAKLRESLRLEIDRLLRELEITTVYVTHDQAEAMALGDRIVVMERGRVAQVGTPQEIYYRPASRFVADFIGTMNRLRGPLRSGYLKVAGGRVPCDGADGETVELGFRPEDARIADAGAGELAGRVATVLFLGDRTRVIVEGAADELIVVESSERRQFAKGDEVRIALRRDAVLRLA